MDGEKGPVLFQSGKWKGRILANQNAPMGMLRIMAGNCGGKKRSFPRRSKEKDARGQGREEVILRKQQTRMGMGVMVMTGGHARKGHIFIHGGDMDPSRMEHR